jgi:2,3-bisphosphoglycerate-dependent phosphoglycerate mutase
MVHSTLSPDMARDARLVLWLVRHGQSTWNAHGLAQGHCDQARLTGLGERQAWSVTGQLCDRPVAALYSSDLHRALATAAPLAAVAGLPVYQDKRLRERCLGFLEGGPTAAITPEFSGIRAQQVVDPDARPEGGESLRDFYRRVAGFVADLRAGRLPAAGPAAAGPAAAELGGGDGTTGEVVIVAHGGTLRMLNACLHGVPVDQMRWEPLGNATMLRFPAPASGRS